MITQDILSGRIALVEQAREKAQRWEERQRLTAELEILKWVDSSKASEYRKPFPEIGTVLTQSKTEFKIMANILEAYGYRPGGNLSDVADSRLPYISWGDQIYTYEEHEYIRGSHQHTETLFEFAKIVEGYYEKKSN